MNKMIKRGLMLLVAGLMAWGCATSTGHVDLARIKVDEALQEGRNQENPFHHHAARHYLKMAEHEEPEMDLEQAKIFAEPARQFSQGEDVAIFGPLPTDTLPARAIASDIQETVRDGAVQCAPEELAHAMATLDHARHEAMEMGIGDETNDEFVRAEGRVVTLRSKVDACLEARAQQQRELRALAIDTDRDLLSDGEELEIYGTDPARPDTDRDGLKDDLEVGKYGTDPLKADTDGDDLMDGVEITRFGTDPLRADTDSGGGFMTVSRFSCAIRIPSSPKTISA